jgi:hypothetical protein
MRKFTIDLEFNEITGATRIVVDFNDDSMSAVEINEAIRNGELLEEILLQTGGLFGHDVARQVREGKIEAVCLDHHPELKKNDTGLLLNNEAVKKQDLKQ